MEPQALIERITRVLSAGFPGVVATLYPGESSDYITGWIVWSGFENVDHVERRRMMKRALAGLAPGDLPYIGAILTLTPDEASDEEAA